MSNRRVKHVIGRECTTGTFAEVGFGADVARERPLVLVTQLVKSHLTFLPEAAPAHVTHVTLKHITHVTLKHVMLKHITHVTLKHITHVTLKHVTDRETVAYVRLPRHGKSSRSRTCPSRRNQLGHPESRLIHSLNIQAHHAHIVTRTLYPVWMFLCACSVPCCLNAASHWSHLKDTECT